jgi:BA14K-like protein
MTKLKLLGAAAILSATIASPALAQENTMGPGYRYGQPAPTYYDQQGYPDNQGYRDHRVYRDNRAYRDDGFAPFDAAAGVVDGAVNNAGAIAAAPFRTMNGDPSYAMMQGDPNYCAQRYRSFDPQSGTYMGYDGRRHPCQ